MRRIKRAFVLLMILVMMLSFTVPTSAAITLSNKKVTLKVGDACTIRVKGTSKKAKWSISNNKVKKVSSTKKNIKIKAVKSGTVYVKCKINGKTYKCKVTVKSSSTSNNNNSSSNNTKYVYISATGTKYHKTDDCGRMNGGTKMTLSDAKGAGYEACKNCY